jgi:DNA-binding MurR/RpiR family transcriptional regulator
MNEDKSSQNSIKDIVEGLFEELSTAERRVARVLLMNYPLSGMQTIAAVSTQAHVSDPTVLRFIKKIGYKKYGDFQNRLKQELDQRIQGPLHIHNDQSRPDSDLSEYLQDFSQSLTMAIEETFKDMSIPEFEGVLDELSDSHKNVYLLGGEFTESIARYAYFHLRKMRSKVHLIQGQLPIRIDHLLELGKKDILVIFDVRRYQQDIYEFAALASKRVSSIILITDQWLSPASEFASYVLPCRVISKSRWDSLIGVTGVVEALMSCVAERQWSKVKTRLESLERIRDEIRSSQYAE